MDVLGSALKDVTTRTTFYAVSFSPAKHLTMNLNYNLQTGEICSAALQTLSPENANERYIFIHTTYLCILFYSQLPLPLLVHVLCPVTIFLITVFILMENIVAFNSFNKISEISHY
jgi:hypothetical protein